MQRRLGAVALCLATALVPAGVWLTTATPAAASPARCTTSGLVIWLSPESNGTAGSIYYTLEFTNLSGHACTLAGYPGVSSVTLSGAQLGSAGSRTTVPAHVVTLAQGASAHTALQVTEAGNYPASSCHLVDAAGIRVYPPGQTASKIVPFVFDACARPGPAILHVRPLS